MSNLSLFSDTETHDPGCRVNIPIPENWTVITRFDGPGDMYRTKLIHVWSDGLPLLMWCLMNPSGADSSTLDMTVSKTAQISKRLGFGGQCIANACAYRATDRMRLLEAADPVGPTNHRDILEMAEISGQIVVSHGKLPSPLLQGHATAMVQLLRGAGYQLHVLRLSSDGTPMHPLARGKGFIPVETAPVLWPNPL